MNVVGIAKVIYSVLQALGLTDYAKQVASKSAPVVRTRNASAVLAVLPMAWARVDRRKTKTQFDYVFEVSKHVGRILSAHQEAITLEATVIIDPWVRAQLLLEAAAGDVFREANFKA